MFIKVCGITNLEDALTSAEAGADALGFNFYQKSPRYIAPEEARRIIEQLPASIMSVGVFVNERRPETVARLSDSAGLGAVQLHGDESPEYCRALRGRIIIKALRVAEDFEPRSVLDYDTDAILLDAYSGSSRGGTGRVLDWGIAKTVRNLVPHLYLAGGLSPENVADGIEAVDPYAVDACSSLESAPGRKSAERVRAFVTAARRGAR